MYSPRIRFDNATAYEAFMGRWSQLVGDIFLPWLAAPEHDRWLDVGCGNGAFTEQLAQRCAPLEVLGVDPSEDQLAFARTRLAGHAAARFQSGDAMALPCTDGAFDAAVMALVIHFVPVPAKAVAEMTRAVRPGGIVASYTWDFDGDGFPYAAMQEEMAALGTPALAPPSGDAARLTALEQLWASAGLEQIDTRQIEVQRSFADFDTFWRIARTGPPFAPQLAAMSPADVTALESRLRARMTAQPDGSITYGARANAIKGLRPAAAGTQGASSLFP